MPANIFAAACNGSKANAGECGKTNHYDTRRRTNKSSEIHRSIVEGGSVKEINFKNHRALENITCITEKMNLMPYAYSYNEKEQKGIFNIVTKNT